MRSAENKQDANTKSDSRFFFEYLYGTLVFTLPKMAFCNRREICYLLPVLCGLLPLTTLRSSATFLLVVVESDSQEEPLVNLSALGRGGAIMLSLSPPFLNPGQSLIQYH